jgi:hypothetical protein
MLPSTAKRQVFQRRKITSQASHLPTSQVSAMKQAFQKKTIQNKQMSFMGGDYGGEEGNAYSTVVKKGKKTTK